MWKTTLYVLVVCAVGAAFAVGLLALVDGSSEAPGGDGAAGGGAAPQVVVPSGALEAIREAEFAVLRETARSMARAPVVLQLADPARATRATVPVLTPNQPPARSSVAVVPSEEELRAPAVAVLESGASELGGAAVALVDVTDGEVVAAAGADAAAYVEALQGRDDVTESTVVGVLGASDGGVVDVVAVPLDTGDHFLLVARPLTAERVQGWVDALGEVDAVSVVRKGTVATTSADGQLARTVKSIAAKLRSAESLAEPPAAVVEPDAAGLRHAVLLQDTLDEARSTTALLLSVKGPPPTAAAAGRAGDDDEEVGVVSALRQPLRAPAEHMPLLVGAIALVVLLALGGGLMARLDHKGSLRRDTRRVATADDLDDAALDSAAARLVDAVRTHTAVAAPKTSPSTPSKAQRQALEKARGEAEAYRLEYEEAASRTAQLERQIEYARGQVTKLQDQVGTLQEERTSLRKNVSTLETRLEAVRDELQKVRAQAEAAEQHMSAHDVQSTVVSPVIETGDAPAVAADDEAASTDIFDDTDALFDEAFSALDGLDEVGGGETIQTPAVSRDDADEEKKPDYDTAEVSGEEMSQLLDEIDTRTTGEFDNIEIPGEAYRSEEFPDLEEEGSLSELPADRITSMSDSAVRRLEEAGGPKAVSDAERREAAEASQEARGNTTSELWRVRRDESSPGQRPPHKRQPKQGRTTLPGGLRFASRHDGSESESESEGEGERRSVAPPPWKKSSSPPRSLSPASLLEALKKRGRQAADEAAEEAPAASGEGEKESTNVARFSRGLLDKTPVRPPRPKSVSQSGLFSRTGSRVDIDPSNDSEYFKSLYEDFVQTKKRCGESVEKITLERFVNRLARNKKALMKRYGCRTVRFQVYVKEGKAALKATPVK